MIDSQFRRHVLHEYGASDDTIDELLEYTTNTFRHAQSCDVPEDEPFVDVWRTYADEARETDAYSCLRPRLVQFAFPIQLGISASDAYLAATRTGVIPQDGPDLYFESPDALRIEIHPTKAGSIPLLTTSERRDFVTLVQALVRRNEPVPVPDSMGACMVSGYNNWDRIRSYKREWAKSNPSESWEREFQRLASRKELYQDRFILLSDGPYSGVSAWEMDMPEEVWRQASLIIRREHECAHYYTRRMLGSMRTNLLDELIADFMGIVAVAGRFRADWFLRFMGLEEDRGFRQTGRFENYTHGLTEGAVQVVQRLLIDAALNLEGVSGDGPHSKASSRRADTLQNLSSFTLEELAVGAFGKA